MARTPFSPSPGEVDLTAGADMAVTVVAMGANVDDAILRQIVESVAYSCDDPEIRVVSSPRLELDRLRAAARELLRMADIASRAAQAGHEEELRLP
jgi:hypothetical protein